MRQFVDRYPVVVGIVVAFGIAAAGLVLAPPAIWALKWPVYLWWNWWLP